MIVGYLYALGFLVIIPLIMGWQALGVWEIAAGSVLAWIIILIFSGWDSPDTRDYELIGTYVLEARYFTEWVERIRHEDKNTKKVTYETVRHPEQWSVQVAEGRNLISIHRTAYYRFVDLFGNEYECNADHRWESRGTIIDPGTCYYTTWPGTRETVRYRYIWKEYENPILRAPNVFEMGELSKEEVKKYQLQDYAACELYGKVQGKDVEALAAKLEEYNCWSRTKQIKLNFILLENAKPILAQYWKQHWKNGKRNSVNVVISLDNAHKIQWAGAFGWQNEGMHVKLRNLLLEFADIADITEHFDRVTQLLEKEYHRADFKQYDYIRPQTSVKKMLLVLTICLSLFCGLFCRRPDPPIDAMRLLEKQKYAAAKKILEPYLLTTTRDGYSYNNLGVVYFMEGNVEDALHFFNLAVERDDRMGEKSVVYHNLSETYRKMGDYKAALRNIQKSVEYSGDTQKMDMCSLYHLYRETNNQKKLRQLIEKSKWKNMIIKSDCADPYSVMPIITTQAHRPMYGRLLLLKWLLRV